MIDWDVVRGEVTTHLQELTRIDTTNPPGNETLAARYLEGVLEDAGFEPTVVESEPGRGNVFATLKGGSQEPLMLLGHTDVVAVEPEGASGVVSGDSQTKGVPECLDKDKSASERQAQSC